MGEYIVYLLNNTQNNCTYVGITNNIIRRLRQHNCIIKGGARYTKMKKGEGEWKLYGYVDNVDKNTALSIERKIKNMKTSGKTPIEKRVNSFNKLLVGFKITPSKISAGTNT